MLEEATMPHYNAMRISKEFQNALRAAREHMGLNRKDLARVCAPVDSIRFADPSLLQRIGEKEVVLAQAEAGQGPLSRNVIQKLEKVLHVRLMHLAPTTLL